MYDAYRIYPRDRWHFDAFDLSKYLLDLGRNSTVMDILKPTFAPLMEIVFIYKDCVL